jgi:RNA polymerase sigma-B factor
MLSFYGERTQAQIAEELGMSQMHVSRLLAMTIDKIRESVMDETGTPIEWPKPRRRRRTHGADGRTGRTRVQRSASAA